MNGIKTILVAHDAGGAELVSLWAKYNLDEFVAIVEGPAVQIFERNLPGFKQIDLRDALRYAHTL